MSEQTGSKRYLIGAGAAACAVCCAPPVLALLGIAGVGTAATIATLAFAGFVAAVVVAAISIVVYLARKRASRRMCKPSTVGRSTHDSRPLPDPVRRGGLG